MLRLHSERQRRFETLKRALHRPTTMLSLVLVLTLPVVILGQSRMTPQQKEMLASVPKGLRGDVLVQVRALGTRMQVPGKEETVLTGQLIDAAGNPRDVRIIYQISGMVRIDGLRERPVAFDGDFPWGFADRTDEALLETFVMDTVEGMVYSARSGAAMRLLGRRFGPNPLNARDYKGPLYDIYEVTAPVRYRQDRQLRLKRYYFDSGTGFLLSTRYTDPTVSPGLSVETRFSAWQQVDGSFYPGRIDRYENGNPMFSLIFATALSRPRQGVANFQ